MFLAFYHYPLICMYGHGNSKIFAKAAVIFNAAYKSGRIFRGVSIKQGSKVFHLFYWVTEIFLAISLWGVKILNKFPPQVLFIY